MFFLLEQWRVVCGGIAIVLGDREIITFNKFAISSSIEIRMLQCDI